MWYFVKIAIVAVLFGVPVIYIVSREWKIKKAEDGKAGGMTRSGSMSFSSFAKVTLVMAPLAVLIALPSHSRYSFYSPDDSALKVAFKHTGKRKVDCDENALIKREGERYRRQLKESKQVKMNIAGLANCPRERFPVILEITLDGEKILDKAYSPTGLKKDMASYVYEEFIIKPGGHKFVAKLFDSGHKDAPDFVYEDSFNIGRRDIKLIRFDDKANMLLLE